MKEQRTTRLRLQNKGIVYTVMLNSMKYTETLIINKLQIGHAEYWLVLQDGVWCLVGDMPLCRELKTRLINKVVAYHGLALVAEATLLSRSGSPYSGRLLNAILSVIAQKKQVT